MYALTWPTCTLHCHLHSRSQWPAIRGYILKMKKWSYCWAKKTPYIIETNNSIRTKLTHLNIILSFTLKVSIAFNKRECIKKWTNSLIASERRRTDNKATKVNICTHLTNLNVMLSNSFIFKVIIASNKKKCTKNKQMVLLLGEEDKPTTKQLALVFPQTWHISKSYRHLHWKSQ